jgi:voltage-gated potassium channel
MTPGAWEGTQRTRPLAEQLAHEEWRRIAGRRGTIFDWSLLVLAAISVGLNAWLLLGQQPPYAGARLDWHQRLLVADLAVCAVFALAICFRWLRFRIGRIYLRRHWWEIPALFPFLVPDLGEQHWVLWIVLAARVARLADRTDNIFGDRFTAALVKHFADPIVDVIKRPITVAVLDEVVDVMKKGTYAENIRRAVDENRVELESMVLELIRRDQRAGRLRFVPFHDDIVRSTTDTVLRILDRALDDPRTTELISDVIRTSTDQVRQAVRERR